MTTPPPDPATVLRRTVASDPGRPRITVYDDTDSPSRGERVELSARVLANWVAKAANLLQEDLDVEPGSVVVLDLPPHWRTLYWAFAVWSVGGCVAVPARRTGGRADAGAGPGAAAPGPPGGDDVLVSDDSAACEGWGQAVLVTLPALARAAATHVPPGVVDEARELATHGDLFQAWADPAPEDPALRVAGADTAYRDIVPADATSSRVHTTTADTAAFLRLALRALAGDGSVVLSRGTPDAAVLDARLASEGVTAMA